MQAVATPWSVNVAQHRGGWTLDNADSTREIAFFKKRPDAHFACRAVNAYDALIAACEWASRSVHHPYCPIARGKGQTTITHDDCTCHVKAAREALALAKA